MSNAAQPAGQRDRRVRLEKKTTTTSASGAQSVAWTAQCVVWASVLPIRGRERLDTYKVDAKVDTRIVVLATKTLRTGTITAAEWRVVDVLRGITYNIESVIEAGLRRETLELMCTSGSNDGR